MDDNILVLIFGHVDFSDIPQLFLVCKRWNALGKCAKFWQPFVAKRLAPFPVKGITAGMLFSLFEENVNEAFGWIFDSKELGKTRRQRYYFDLYKHAGFYTDLHGNVTQFERHENIKIKYSVQTVTTIQRLFGSGNGVFKLQIAKDSARRLIMIKWIEYKTPDGVYFKGSAVFNEQNGNHGDFENIIPHGAGCWTFPDGSTFSGDNVAYGGLPHGFGIWNHDKNQRVEFDYGH